MNVLLLKRWLSEEGPALIGGRLKDVSQADERSLVLEFATEDGLRYLLLSVLEEFPALAMITDPVALINPGLAPGNFAKALTFHLAGYQLDSIAQSGYDRSVVFTFSQRDTYGQETVKVLRHELVGRASNAYLISDRDMVVSIFKRVRHSQNRVRHIMTGKPLPEPPPLGKFIAATTSVKDLADELAELAQREGVASATGIESFFSRRVACCDLKLWPAVDRILPVEYHLQSLHDFIGQLQRGEHTAALFDLKVRGDANLVTLKLWETARTKRGLQTPRPNVQREKVANRLDQLLAQRKLADQADVVEQLGLEMLRQTGAVDSVQPDGFLKEWCAQHSEWRNQISLERSVYDNAQELIHYAQRLRRGRGKLDALVTNVQAELVKAERGHPEQRKPGKPADPLASQRRKLERDGIKFLRFISSDGMHILCGVSDKSNDGLLRAFSSGRHTWLHVRDYPGSHVIILSGGSQVPPRTLEEAALIAAFHSQGRKETELEVSYLPMKHVRRPRGGKPGQVLKTSEKVLTVRPSHFEAIKERLHYSSQ